jgi:hypothetical protein
MDKPVNYDIISLATKNKDMMLVSKALDGRISSPIYNFDYSIATYYCRLTEEDKIFLKLSIPDISFNDIDI